MRRYVFASIRMAVVTLLVLGIGYPMLVTGLAGGFFPAQASGSLVTSANGVVVGSALLGQHFSEARYFHGRPSAGGYDAAASGASNLGPTSRALVERVTSDVVAARTADGLGSDLVPVDMVTASGSGLDPDITLANAYAQVARVASARGVSPERVRGIVVQQAKGRQFGVLGEARVNVLLLNMALDTAE